MILDKEQIKNVFKKFCNYTILCVGDIMVDEYIIGNVDRISPEAPTMIIDIKNKFLKLGGCGNVVSNIVSLGGNAIPCGITGIDNGRLFIRSELKKISNDVILLSDPNRPTTKKTRIFSDNQQMLRVDRESRNNISEKNKSCIFNQIEELKNKYDAIIISDYQKGLLDYNFTQKIINFGRKNNKPVFVDPKGSYEKYKGANFITPNLKELSLATGMITETDDQIYDASIKLYNNLGIDGLIITRGKDGISIVRNDSHKMVTLPTRAKEVYDVSGCGDTVIATFVLSYLSGLSIEKASEIANLTAGVVATKVGTSSATLKEILRMI